MASDCPQPDAQFPGALKRTLESPARLPAASRERILGAHAARPDGIGRPGPVGAR